jgi:hypothetical protein
VSSSRVRTGSKRRARQLARADREVARTKRDLQEIARLAPLIRDDAHLRQILADIPDATDRAAVARLLDPFRPFRLQRVELT